MITEKFKLQITEGMARFDEIIEINEDNDSAYMKVPSHNEFVWQRQLLRLENGKKLAWRTSSALRAILLFCPK